MSQRSGAAPQDQPACPPGCIDRKVASEVIAAATDLALVVEKDGTIREVTVTAGGPGGPPWSSLVGKRFEESTAVDSRSKVELLLKEARAGAVTRAREMNLKLDGGAEVPFRFSAVPLGEADRVVVLGRDLRPIAALQQQMVGMQQAMDREFERMRQAETRYRLLFQVTSEAVLVLDAASLKVVEANPAAASLHDEPPPAMQGRSMQELVVPKSWPAVQALLAAAAAGGRPAETAVQLAGSRRPVHLSVSTFRQSGALLLLVRLRPEAETGVTEPSAAARTGRVMAVVDKLPDGFVVIGEDRRILLANPAFCDMVQQTGEAQVIGQPLDRWLGRPGVDLNILIANLREHGSVRNFSTVVVSEYRPAQQAVVSAVSALTARTPCLGFVIRTVNVRLGVVPGGEPAAPRSVDQLVELVGRVSLKEIVRESTDLIERLCIEAALKVSGDNRASAAQLLGLSRQGLYSKLRRHGLGDLDPGEIG
ncbi:MAG TPA: transcriptional regulator PpsR [Myxococcaceae bacterium]|nr:transcriptional regulator PpsR [Myxococcaceae bacterium]